MKTTNKFWGATATVALVAVVLASSSLLTHAATGTGTASLNPASGSVTVGSNIVVAIHENSLQTPVTGVDVTLNYPSNLLQYVSADTQSPFTIAAPDGSGAGTVEIVRGAASGGITGDQLVTNVTFKTLATGTASITFNSTKSYVSATSDGSHLSETYTNGSYTVAAAVTPTCPAGDSGTYPNCVAPVKPSCPSGYSGVYPACAPPVIAPVAPAAPVGTTKGSSVTVSSTGTTGGVTVPNNGTAQVNTPVTVQPTTVQTTGVNSVQYYLNGKLVATETKPPYSYHVNTVGLKGGTYSLKTVTNYQNGTTKSSTQNLVVKDTSVKKPASKVGPVIVIIILIVMALSLFLTLRPHKPLTPKTPVPAPAPDPDPTPVATTPQTVVPASEQGPATVTTAALASAPDPAPFDLNRLHDAPLTAPGSVVTPGAEPAAPNPVEPITPPLPSSVVQPDETNANHNDGESL